MQKAIHCFTLILLSFAGQSQTLDGTYFALELNDLAVDTTGKVYFYMSDSFPRERWFYEVNVEITGSKIVIDKYPVFFDSSNRKWYSASDGGFLTYRGTLTKSGDAYISRAKLVDCDYIGFSVFAPPKITKDVSSDSMSIKQDTTKVEPLDLNKFERYKTRQGYQIYLPKGTIRQDFIIRPDKEGLWINNKLYYRRKSKAPNKRLAASLRRVGLAHK